jgi:Capsule assembly protein Wzi
MPPPAVTASLPSQPPYDPSPYIPREFPDPLGSTYIPVDSPIYPMAMRLYSMGYLDSAFIGLRPWTRRSLLHMLQKSTHDIMNDGNGQAVAILAKLNEYLSDEVPGRDFSRGRIYGVETVYTRFLGISGQSLRDSFHLGQTIANDYGRPYEPGFNNITGFSSVNEMGRFSLYVRGEYQHSPTGAGYSPTLSAELSCSDEIAYPGFRCSPQNQITTSTFNLNQATIPTGPVAAQNPFRLQEAVLSVHLWGHEISGGKSDAWLGPAMGGAMAWSNNAENIYSFRINRVEPLHIPWVSAVLGPIRYDFFVGSLKGHTDPNSPWVHSEMFSFRPTKNVEVGFQRTVIWGGEGHVPVNLHTFFRSFFSTSDTTAAEKASSADPGARFTAFNFSWRLPYISKYVTLYTDSESHDDVTPPSAPRRAAYRPGVYISQFPRLPKLDFRIEGVSTDTSTLRSLGGQFNYWEGEQPQGYTNKGFIMGDWIGREAKGGQAWLTYHLSSNEWVQIEYLNKKTPKDFIPGGTTQNQFKAEVVKRLPHDIELDAWLQYERWKAPVPLTSDFTKPLQIVTPVQNLYLSGPQNDTTIAVQFTWHPKLHTDRNLAGR